VAVSKRLQRVQRTAKMMGLLTVATFALGAASLYLPWSMAQENHARLQEKQQELQEAQQAASQLQQVQDELQTTQRNLQFLERGVSQAAYVPTMLKQFEQTVRQLNLQIVAIRPQAPPVKLPTTNPDGSTDSSQPQEPPKPYDEQLFEIQLRGKFWDTVRLLKGLETFPKILAVQSLNAQAKTTAEESTENPDLEIKMVVKAFIFREGRGQTSTASSGG
jgi:Tfp pilus assembly protein PilO